MFITPALSIITQLIAKNHIVYKRNRRFSSRNFAIEVIQT